LVATTVSSVPGLSTICVVIASASTSSTLSPAAITSTPMPSPGIAAILYSRMSAPEISRQDAKDVKTDD